MSLEDRRKDIEELLDRRSDSESERTILMQVVN
jgi:hypothetical protein